MENSKVKLIELEKGQKLEIPKSILEQLSSAPGGRFLIMGGKDFITIKKVCDTSPRENFQTIARAVQKKARTLKVSAKTSKEAVVWSRKRS